MSCQLVWRASHKPNFKPDAIKENERHFTAHIHSTKLLPILGLRIFLKKPTTYTGCQSIQRKQTSFFVLDQCTCKRVHSNSTRSWRSSFYWLQISLLKFMITSGLECPTKNCLLSSFH